MSTERSGGQVPRAHDFYRRVLSRAERLALEEARQVPGVDEEIAVLRVRLRSLLQEGPVQAELLFKGMGLLLRAMATRYRLSPQGQDNLAGAVGRLMEEVRAALGLGEEQHHGP